jgi:hypothetical protein
VPTPTIYWKLNSSVTPPRLQVGGSVNRLYELIYKVPFSSSKTFDYKKTYQFITHTVNLYSVHGSFSVRPPWPESMQQDLLSYSSGMSASNVSPGLNATQSFFHYSSPTSTVTSTNLVTYRANGTFSSGGAANKGITDFIINELDFKLQGFSYYRVTASEQSAIISNSLGWHYDKNSDRYHWYDRVTGSPSNTAEITTGGVGSPGYFPVGGPNGQKKSDIGYRLNNALIKFIPYSYFNFSFSYQNRGAFPLNIYTSDSPPSKNPSIWPLGSYTPPTGSVLLGTLTQSNSGTYSSIEYSVSHNFYGVRGNKYLIFVGGFAGASASGTTFSSIYLSNIKIDGGYYSGNNRQYLMSPSVATFFGEAYLESPAGLTGAAYSALIGTGNTINATQSLESPGISKIYSKIGNGKFTSGIWENGVWNSGWRVDEKVFEFYNIGQYVSYIKDKRWRLQIIGSTSSVSNFNIGDNVSIGNIIAIDINEDRKILKNYYTIINKIDNSIFIEFDNDFPLRRIEKDSEYHRIYVTKNIWLSGAFLNGYFKGIWNYGLFKGYPLITEMYDSHWIDGIFDGGHFKSSQYTIPNFVDTIFESGSVSLTFSTPHGLAVGDLIKVDKSDKTINPEYDGEHYVTEVINPYQIKTDIDWGSNTSLESGALTIDLSSGILQNVDFKSNNISKITSGQSMESDSVFVYNSWMDLIYNSSYASNIGKPQTLLNPVSLKSYSENNLYGYTTKDILESDSNFRDSFSITKRNYKLGIKYKIFSDFIGDAGKFENQFGSSEVSFNAGLTNSVGGDVLFIKDGWTFSNDSSNYGGLTFSTTNPNESNEILGEELKIEAFGKGGILDITPFSNNEVLNKTNEEIQKFRYTKVEFDLITYSNNLSEFESIDAGGKVYLALHKPYTFKQNLNNYQSPHIHFNNVNFINREVTLQAPFASASTIIAPIAASYLPIYSNINHLTTPSRKKSEYFYNKRNLAMHFYGYSQLPNTESVEYIIDNLHFYEVDMIPFFQYFTEDNINKGVVIPYQGLSPFIDYTNSNFNFIDSLSIGLNSIPLQNSNILVSGVAVGIGVGGVGGGINPSTPVLPPSVAAPAPPSGGGAPAPPPSPPISGSR